MTILANVLAVLHSYNRSFNKYVIYDFRLFAELLMNVLWAIFKNAPDQQKNNIAEHSKFDPIAFKCNINLAKQWNF